MMGVRVLWVGVSGDVQFSGLGLTVKATQASEPGAGLGVIEFSGDPRDVQAPGGVGWETGVRGGKSKMSRVE